VKLVNLPTAPNAPVELFVSKKSFFQSAADGNPVNADVTIPFQVRDTAVHISKKSDTPLFYSYSSFNNFVALNVNFSLK